MWVHSQQSVPAVDETVEPEPACDSVRSHCSEGEASLDTPTDAPQVELLPTLALLVASR